MTNDAELDALVARLRNWHPAAVNGRFDPTCSCNPCTAAKAADAITALREELRRPGLDWETARDAYDAARTEANKWLQAYQSVVDPVVRTKMLEPAPVMVAPLGAAEQVLLRERDAARAEVERLRTLLQEASDDWIPHASSLSGAIVDALRRGAP